MSRTFLEVTIMTADAPDTLTMLGMSHIVRIVPAKEHCVILMDDGEVVTVRESYQRLSAILSGIPVGLVNMMEEDARQ